MQAAWQRINSLLDEIWPPDEVHLPHGSRRAHLGLFALTLMGGLLLGWLLHDTPWLGHDWLIMFHANTSTDLYYPPWTSAVLAPLANLPWRSGLALVNGISLAAVALNTYHQGVLTHNRWRALASLLAVLSLQMAILLWVGHIDGLALLGLLGLPWLAPLVLMKATFVGFAVLTRKRWFLASLGFGLLSLLLWPGWPLTLGSTLGIRATHPSAAGWGVTGWLPPLLGLVLLLLSKRTDWLQAVAAGSLLYPFSLPYHWLVLLPALGTLRGLALLACWLAAWLMLLPIGLNQHHWLYFVFPVMVWWLRYRTHGTQHSWLALVRRFL